MSRLGDLGHLLHTSHGINSWSTYYDGIRYQTHSGYIDPMFLAQYGYSRNYRTGYLIMAQGVSKSALKVLNRTILPYLEPKIEKPPVDKITTMEENEYFGCYEQIQKSRLKDPAFRIEIIRDSTGQLSVHDENFDDPKIKTFKPTN